MLNEEDFEFLETAVTFYEKKNIISYSQFIYKLKWNIYLILTLMFVFFMIKYM